MGLQWMLLTCVVGAEAAVAALLTLPAPRAVRAQIVGLTSMLLQPLAGVLPFAAFQLLDIYWKNEHRLVCTGEMCTSEERVRFEKSCSSCGGESETVAAECTYSVWKETKKHQFSSPRGMSSFVFQYLSFIGPSIVSASSTRTLRHWRRLRSASRMSRFILVCGGFCGIPGLQQFSRCIQTLGYPMYIWFSFEQIECNLFRRFASSFFRPAVLYVTCGGGYYEDI